MSQKAPIIEAESPILHVECPSAFNLLSLKEKLYAYYFTRAAWSGAKICYFQRSYESPALFYILQRIFLKENPSALSLKLQNSGSFSEQEVRQLFVYIASFFQNCGNYKSFGDTKFIPEITKEKFHQFITLTDAYKENSTKLESIWEQIHDEIYHYDHPYYLIEMSDKNGLSSYYSPNVTTEEGEKLTKFLEEHNISPLNTRVIKQGDSFTVLVASASKLNKDQSYTHEDLKVEVVFGDFSQSLTELNHFLSQALVYAANENQKNMIVSYLEHFNQGDIDLHKDSQRWWIKDKGPSVETNIGFIESYLDPIKVRAEFEGFVSIVNKTESLKLNKLVDNAEHLISQLPWGKDFEVEKFTKPDFTSLEILCFACSGTPVGINIPNYDDIRQKDGFKNVNLGNVYGTPNIKNVLFLRDHDKELFVKYYQASLFVVVALHELLGHGTGKLFQKDAQGSLNFNPELVNPLTGHKVETFYQHNENWHGTFGEVSSGYEECRADGVALFLSCFQESLDILIPEVPADQQEDVVYMCWMDIILGSIRGLEYYDPSQKKWGQAHIRASYALLQVLLRAGQGLINIEVSELNGAPYLYINLDKSKIKTVGKQAIGDFLKKLQIYKSLADSKNGIAFFEEITTVPDEMLKWRDIAIARKLPRKIELQDDVQLVGKDEDVVYKPFNKSFEGVIESHVYHYGGRVEDVYEEWNRNQKHFRLKREEK